MESSMQDTNSSWFDDFVEVLGCKAACKQIEWVNPVILHHYFIGKRENKILNKKKLAETEKAKNNVAVVNLDDNLYIDDML